MSDTIVEVVARSSVGTTCRMSVPGGWLYVTTALTPHSVSVTQTFVPEDRPALRIPDPTDAPVRATDTWPPVAPE